MSCSVIFGLETDVTSACFGLAKIGVATKWVNYGMYEYTMGVSMIMMVVPGHQLKWTKKTAGLPYLKHTCKSDLI